MEKRADESMSAIKFCTTPKGDLPQYSYFCRSPDPLGPEMNNLSCSRLETMLHLNIQKGEKDVKISTF